MKELAALEKLEELYLAQTLIDDDTIPLLQQFPKLRKLRLAKNSVTSEGLAHLPNCSNLQDLDLSEAINVTDDALEHIGKITTLTRLNLWRDTISDAGVAHLAGLTNLVWLNLDNTGLTDDGLAHLSTLTNLDFLHLGSTQITDAGLPHLKGLKMLSHLEVTRTGVSEEGAAALKKELVNTTIQLLYLGTE
jgi:Leucine-rich repeat (LRR) protein